MSADHMKLASDVGQLLAVIRLSTGICCRQQSEAYRYQLLRIFCWSSSASENWKSAAYRHPLLTGIGYQQLTMISMLKEIICLRASTPDRDQLPGSSWRENMGDKEQLLERDGLLGSAAFNVKYCMAEPSWPGLSYFQWFLGGVIAWIWRSNDSKNQLFRRGPSSSELRLMSSGLWT